MNAIAQSTTLKSAICKKSWGEVRISLIHRAEGTMPAGSISIPCKEAYIVRVQRTNGHQATTGQIYRIADLAFAQGCDCVGVWNDPDAETLFLHVRHRETDAVHRH